MSIQLIDIEDEFIRDWYWYMPLTTMARKLGRSKTFVEGRMRKMKIKRSPELIEKFKRDSRYKKGHVPANKGMKQEEYMNPEAIERTKATRFKKGNIPQSHIDEIGVVTCRKDSNGHSYKWIKIAEYNWKEYHRYLWEEAHGPIPEDKILVFKDGNQMNCRLDNLELITREENMRRNTILRYPDELQTSMRTLGRLKKKIKNAKEQKL